MREIDFEVALETLRDDVKFIYTIIRPGIKFEDIEYYEFNEGIVNSIVRLDDPKSRDPIVVRTYRIKIKQFSKSTHQNRSFKFINRKLELAAVEKASELGITVKLIAKFNNGFVYKYFDGEVISAKTYDLEIGRKVAQKLAKLHTIKLIDAREKPLVYLWSEIKEDPYYDEKQKLNERMKEKDYDEFTIRLPLYLDLQDEYSNLNELIFDKNGYGSINACHNDLCLNNILIEKSTKEPCIIDFEMVNTNFQNFDIAYHLLQLGGVFARYFNREDLPDDDQIKNFLRAYHEESNKSNNFQSNEKEFSDFVDDLLIKIQAIMLSIRILLIQRALFHDYLFPGKLCKHEVKEFCFSLYDDYLAKKDKYLQLLNSL